MFIMFKTGLISPLLSQMSFHYKYIDIHVKLIEHFLIPAHTRQFEVGTLYVYEYETAVLVNEPQPLPISTPKDVGFKVALTAEVTPVWQHPSNTNEQILQLTVSYHTQHSKCFIFFLILCTIFIFYYYYNCLCRW